MAVFRRAERRDRSRVLALWEEAGLERTEDDEWEALIAGPYNLVLVAQEADRLVGTVIATFDGWRAYIYHVAVAPDSRERGLGLQLMEAAETHLRQSGARRIFIEVHQDNTAGLALAAVAGYLPEGDIVLEKELCPVTSGSRSEW
ncbi:MAG: GNAT family N-acetyltransferase [Chloroflexi bacterium]|nr:GNAT family N-acetyltransferase [Chloroflexota bacterium]